MKTWIFLTVVLLSACSHAPSEADRRQNSDSAIASLNRAEVTNRLGQNAKELEALDARLVAARARRDNLQIQASTDVNKQNAVDGADAEISSIQEKRAQLLHEQHALEARDRELGE